MDVHIDYTIEEIAGITGGNLVSNNPGASVTHLLLDSRKLIFPETTIFFALKNTPEKAAGFIEDLYAKGVKNFLTDTIPDPGQFTGASFIVVNDTLAALQTLAIHHRSKFNLPVIGITGSNGKTIVKEWLNQLLQPDLNIVRSPKSYNSQIGVPLSVLQISDQHALGIFEAGISTTGEMERLERMIQPFIGILTNIGEAHSEGFDGRSQKLREKLKLFTDSSLIIFCNDHPEVCYAVAELKEINRKIKFLTWGKKDADLAITSVKKKENVSVIKAKYSGKEIQVSIPFVSEASVENAISCWCIMLHLGVPHETIEKRMLQLHPVEMRLELRQGINNCSLINDSYSNDLSSLKIALDFLEQQQQHTKRTVILSDILQSGKSEKELYAEVGSLLRQKKIEKLAGIGPGIYRQQDQFHFLKEKNFYVSADAFKKDIPLLYFNNETILLKGARIFEFEQIGLMLEQKIHQTILSVDLTAIAHNLKQYRSLLRPHVKIMAVVKAFGYGSGSFEIANLLQFHKVDYLAVAYADEGIELRKAGISLPIMVMNPEENTFSSLVQYNLEPEIFSFGILSSFERYLDSQATRYFPVHLKLDTGMHRLGFEEKDMAQLAGHLKNDHTIKVQSVFSHLASAEDAEQDEFTKQQFDIFLQCCETIRKATGYDFIKHISNTTAATRHPGMHLDMLRIGIGLYGIDSNIQSRLKNVLTLTTTISQIRQVRTGDSIGYSRASILKSDSVIATVRIGYADGYPRSLGNGIGKMLVKNTPAPVTGNICMDMTMLDITGIKNVREGEEVMVFGEPLPVEVLARWCNTIPYEIMTGVSQRVKRIYFEE